MGVVKKKKIMTLCVLCSAVYERFNVAGNSTHVGCDVFNLMNNENV